MDGWVSAWPVRLPTARLWRPAVQYRRCSRSEPRVEGGARSAGRPSRPVSLTARLNACVAADGRQAREIVRPTVARLLGRGSLKLATAAAQGLTLPEEATAPMADAPYADGVKPYLSLLPLITDRHVDAFTLAGTKAEVTAHLIALRRAGIDSLIARPLAGEAVPIEDTTAALGEIWHTLGGGLTSVR